MNDQLIDPNVSDDEPVPQEPSPELSKDEIQAARRVVPPITLGSTLTDPREPFVPPEVRRRAEAAAVAGHEVRLYRAIGPKVDHHGFVVDPACRTLGLRVDAPGRTIIAAWEWRGDVVKVGWRYSGGWIAPGRPSQVEGAPYRLPREAVGISVIDAAIKGTL